MLSNYFLNMLCKWIVNPNPTTNINVAAMLSLILIYILLCHLCFDCWWVLGSDFGTVELIKSVAFVQLSVFEGHPKGLELTAQQSRCLWNDLLFPFVRASSAKQQPPNPIAQHLIFIIIIFINERWDRNQGHELSRFNKKCFLLRLLWEICYQWCLW